MQKNTAFITCDLGFGDFGKGTIVDSLVRQYNSDLVIRYSGASQAAHHVVTPEGITHCFSQFGSGTLAGAKTFLSKYMLINPLTLEDEASHLVKKGIADPYENLYIDENCIVITPFHRAVNKLIELSRGKDAHGSCANGVWEAVKDSLKGEEFTLRIKDFNNYGLIQKLDFIQAWKNLEILPYLDKLTWSKEVDSAYAILHDGSLNAHCLYQRYKGFFDKINVIKDNGKSLINNSTNPIFEAAQGILLDQDHGFSPYNSATTTTTKNAEELLKNIEFSGKIEKIGITRTYFTRHGNGPFPTEGNTLGLTLDDHNKPNPWQGNFREGNLDLVLLANAIKVNRGIDYLAITHVDKLNLKDNWQVCTEYQSKSNDEDSATLIRYVLQQGLQRHCEDFAKMLEDAKPFYTTVHKDSVIDLISNTLNVPVKIISSGQTYKDKQYLP